MTQYELQHVQRLVDLASEQMDPAHANDEMCMCWTHRWRRAVKAAAGALGVVL